MRPVEYYKWWRPADAKYDAPYEKVRVGTAMFHCFSVDSEHFDNGVGNYPAAVIELEGGEVQSIPAELIRFIDQA